jgi:precorrin-6A/cobalt-precorrin-6A reductase
MAEPATVLILGGTAEAAVLARGLAARDGLRVVTSLAGRTRHPAQLAGEVRSGGFGGVEGLARALRDEQVCVLVDATHPYAATISAHAAEACARAGVPHLHLDRPSWQRQAGDTWIDASDAAAAARAVADLGTRVFLTIGHTGLAAFAALPGHWFLVRLIEAPPHSLPLPHHELLLDRGPFDTASERALLDRHRIHAVVCKNSGGAATYGKIAAARDLGLPVVLLARPPGPDGPRVETPDAAIAWINRHLALPSPA